MRYLITFAYDGTNFKGYQKQPKLRTVQGEIENALKKISGGLDIELNSSGRTDGGVHALNQKAHFDLDKKIALHKLVMALNTYTNNDIYIKDIKVVDNNFHARYMVKKKEYMYKINMGEYNPLDRNYIFQYNKPLNINRMKKESKYLIGTHDFSSFANKEDKKESYVRTIYKIDIKKHKNILIIKFTGNGFLKYQVRNMVGALIEVSNNNKSIKNMLEQKNRKTFGKIAPAEGLYLSNVEY
jgi:tRNA pseudouridine38-40 synthase